MSSSPVIRAATASDIPAITAIYGEAVTNGTGSFELEPPSQEDMAARLAKMARSGHPWLVAEIDGAVVGYAYAGPYRERPAYRFTVEDAIYLRPDLRGRGLGKRLLAELIAEAERRGYRQMIGIVGDSANQASVRLHLSLGFEQVGVLGNVGWKHDRWLDTVFTQLALGKAANEAPD